MNSTRTFHRRKRTRRKGAMVVAALVCLLVVAMIAAAMLKSILVSHRQSQRSQQRIQALWLAESGISRGRARLAETPNYKGETWKIAEPLGKPAVVVITIASLSESQTRIVARAVYPDDSIHRAVHQSELTINRPASGANE